MAVISFILILKEIRLHLPSSAEEPSLLEARDKLESEDKFTSPLKSFRQKDTKNLLSTYFHQIRQQGSKSTNNVWIKLVQNRRWRFVSKYTDLTAGLKQQLSSPVDYV